VRPIEKMILSVPVLGRLALTGYRAGLSAKYLLRPFKYWPGWLIKSKETTNFTYDLADANRRYLAALTAGQLSSVCHLARPARRWASTTPFGDRTAVQITFVCQL